MLELVKLNMKDVSYSNFVGVAVAVALAAAVAVAVIVNVALEIVAAFE